MRTGRPRPAPEPPARMSPPKASDPSTSTITLSWDVAVSSVSYNSGKTPRFTDGKIRTDICPRPSHLIPFPKGDPYDSVHVRGDREAKLVHFEVFDSAYAQYYNGGEPDFTYSDHVFTGTVDYIFYSKKVPNPRRQHHWLPNQTFSSDHVALMAKIAFRAEELAVAWN
ncbi:hypothetical protein DYB28_014054 [Aphanomyces astaci]|uniref:Endonuclease/exonuclease/phosphatase domain-containing protein n=1 Tax=Aphanomyces astaci TaxID=112090 RepID=A0A9X8H6K9_APHAT|nr:hypothetical protein DYB28_014054 [Aphanomyces astaci]